MRPFASPIRVHLRTVPCAQQIEAEHLVDDLHANSMLARGATFEWRRCWLRKNRLRGLYRPDSVSCPVLLSLTPVEGVKSTT